MCDQRKTVKPGPIQQPAFWCAECQATICGQDSPKEHNEMYHKGDRDVELEEESSENLCSGKGKERQVEQDDDEPGLKKLALESKSRPRAFQGPLNEKAGTSGKMAGTVEEILPGPTADVGDEDVKITYYDCKLCGQAFRQLQILRSHLESVHKIDPSLLDQLLDVVAGKRIDRQKPSEDEHELDRERRRKPASVEIDYLPGTRQRGSAEGRNRSSTQAHPSPHVTSLSQNNAAGGKRFKSGVRTTNPPTKDNRLSASVGAKASAGRTKKLWGGYKRHQCDQCPEAFRTPLNLDDHKAAMHRGEGPYDCPRCDFKYWCRYTMTTHMKSAHRMVGHGVLAKRAANANP